MHVLTNLKEPQQIAVAVKPGPNVITHTHTFTARCSPVRNGQASVNSTLQGSEHLVARSGPGQASVQVAGECAWLAVDALHVELVACDLHLALVHLVQAEFVEQLWRRLKVILIIVSSKTHFGNKLTISFNKH